MVHPLKWPAVLWVPRAPHKWGERETPCSAYEVGAPGEGKVHLLLALLFTISHFPRLFRVTQNYLLPHSGGALLHIGATTHHSQQCHLLDTYIDNIAVGIAALLGLQHYSSAKRKTCHISYNAEICSSVLYKQFSHYCILSHMIV